MTELFLAIATLLLSYQAPTAQSPADGITEKEAVEFARQIDLVRGGLHFMDGKNAPARDAALQAVKNLPDLADPHWLLIEITLKDKKHAETVERLNAIEKALQVRVRPATLESDPEYADFLKSPEGRDWIKSRAAK